MELIKSFLELLCEKKDLFESISYSITSLAIVIGGYWTYLRFIKNRGKFPRADVSHSLNYFAISTNRILLILDVCITNSGEVLLPLNQVRTSIYQIMPIPKKMNIEFERLSNECELDWLKIESCSKQIDWPTNHSEIEPGEKQTVHFEFIIDGYIEIIKIYTFIPNILKKDIEIGWDKSSIFSLTKGGLHE